MTATYQAADDMPAPSPIARLWQRQLSRYPNNGMRFLSLFIVVATTVVLYYQLYLSGAVAVLSDPRSGGGILTNLHMSFLYFVNIAVIGYAFGALASVIAGLADRYGRANIVTAGLLVTGVLSLGVLPHVHTELPFAITYIAIGFVEGIVLVATPALIRDFSPQLGRASAMGGWTLGPVLGSLVVAVIVTNTSSHTWQWQYGLSGIVGLVVFVIALLGLRELAPSLRDQLMVSQKDRALIEMRAKGLDIEESLKRPFRQMLKLDIVGSAFAISVFLIIYYVAVGFFPIFFQTIFGYSAGKANGLGDYFWACDAGALLIVGIISDILGVRKPFMIVGALGSIAFTTLFAIDATHNQPGNLTSHGTFVLLLIGISVFLGIAFAPWMASFTETVERRNPALTATGLAVWGLIIRVVIAVVIVFVPHIVNTVSTIVDKGGQIQKYEADTTPITTAAGATTVGKVVTAVAGNAAVVGQVQVDGAKYGKQLTAAAIVQAKVDPTTLAALQANANDTVAGLKAVGELTGLPAATIISGLTTNPQVVAAVADLKTAATLPANVATLFSVTAPKALGTANFAALIATGSSASPQLATALAYLGAHGADVVKAQGKSPKQWRTEFFIGVGGEIVFIPLVFLMAGYWSPRKAKQAAQEHEAMVASEMAKLQDA